MTPLKRKRKRSLNSNPAPEKKQDIDPALLPAHVAIIMDGNGRWAKKRLLNRVIGHEKGSDAVRTVVRTSREIGIRYLTLFAFSTEDWERPKTEVAALMKLLDRFLKSELDEMRDNDIRLQAIGQIDRLPASVQKTLRKTIDLTKHGQAMQLNLALSYGGRADILRMARMISQESIDGRLTPAAITPDIVSGYLYTKDLPDPDLLIRTSGEMRISNFMLWQIAYSELYITDTLWPDFNKEEYLRILNQYQSRDRRFGKIKE